MRKSITEDVDEEPDKPVEAPGSSKLVDGMDWNPSELGFSQRTDTSLGVGAPVDKHVLKKVRLE